MADPRKPVLGALKAIQTASKAADEELAAGKLKAALEAQQAPMTRPQGTGLPLMPRDQGMYTPREQKDLPRMPTVDKARAANKSPKYNERTQDLLDSRKARGKVDDLINKGKELDVKEWYGTEPLRQVAMDAGRTPEQFESLMAQLASASQRNPVDKQNQMGSYLYHLSETGQLPADSLLLTNKLKKALKDDPSLSEGRTLIELPKGYGSLAQGDIFNRAVMIGQGDIAGALPPNKKLGTFYENLLGNLKPVTVDVNALRGPIIEQGDPRWLASKLVEKDDKGKVINSYKPREMFDTGEMTMREAKQRPGFWEAAPKGSEYAGFEELWQRGAKRHNIEPAEAQALGWYGSADVTALKTKPENYVDNLERLIKRTAEQTGKSPTEVMNDMVTGKGFLRKDGGAVSRKESPEDMARFQKRFAMHKAIGGKVKKMAGGGRVSIFDAPKMASGGRASIFDKPVHMAKGGESIDKSLKQMKNYSVGDQGASRKPNELGGVILAGASWMAGDEKTKLAKQAFGEDVTNTAIGGQKTADVLNQLNVFKRDGGTFAPNTTVVLDIGANDIAQGVDEATIRNNLNEIVSRLGDEGVQVILSGQPEAHSYEEAISSTNLQMDDLYQDIAANNPNVTLVDAMSGMLNDKTLMDESGFHLNSDDAKLSYLNQFANAYKDKNETSQVETGLPKEVGQTTQTESAVDIPREIEQVLQVSKPEERYTPEAQVDFMPAVKESEPSAGYMFAQQNQGLDTYYQDINKYVAENHSPEEIQQAMQYYGVNQADIDTARDYQPSGRGGIDESYATEQYKRGGAVRQESPEDMARFNKRFAMHKAFGGHVKKMASGGRTSIFDAPAKKFDGGGIASPEESSASSDDKPTKAGLMAEYLAKAAKEQGKEELSSLKKPRAATDILNRGVLANNPVSAVIDMVNMGLVPLDVLGSKLTGRDIKVSSEKPFLGSEHVKDLMNQYGVTSGEERPMMETALSFVSPTGMIKGAQKTANLAKKAPQAVDTVRGGLETMSADVQRPFRSATLTMEGVAPDLGQKGGDKFKDLVTKRMISGEGAPVGMERMGGRKTEKTMGQGLYENFAGQQETNPMVGVTIPRAGNLSTNKRLIADIGTAGQELGQEMVAAHKFTPLMFKNPKDATAMMIGGSERLTKDQIQGIADSLPGMIVTHSPKNNSMFVAPFEGDALDYKKAAQAASEILGKGAKVQFGKADSTKDIMFRGDYEKMGARPPSAESTEMRNRLKKAEERIVRGPPVSQSGRQSQPSTLTSTVR